MVLTSSQRILDIGTGTGIWAMCVLLPHAMITDSDLIISEIWLINMNRPKLSALTYLPCNQLPFHRIANSRSVMPRVNGLSRLIAQTWSSCVSCWARSRTGLLYTRKHSSEKSPNPLLESRLKCAIEFSSQEVGSNTTK